MAFCLRARACRLACLAVLCGVISLGLAGLVYDYADDGHSWLGVNNGVLLYEGRAMVEGASLYVDWRDTNPPSIYLLTAAVAASAGAAGAPVTLSYYLLTVMMGALGLWILDRSLRDNVPEAARCGVLLAFAAFLFHPLHQPLDFAEREHLFALLFVPAVVFVGARKEARRTDLLWIWALGFLAMMKPHFLAGVLAVGAVGRARGRTLSPRELLAFAAGVASPLAGLYLHSRESFRAFFQEVVPMHLDGSYGQLEQPWSAAIDTAPLLLAAGSSGILGVGALAWRRGAVSTSACASWAAAWLVMFAGALHQQKFWDYHFVPVAGLLVVAAGYLAGTAIESSRPRVATNIRFAFVLAMGLFALAATTDFIARTAFASRTALSERLLELVDVGDSVLAVSTHVVGVHDPEYRTIRALGPWPGHFLLPATAAIPDPERRSLRLAAHAAEIRERIADAHPDLVLLSTDETPFEPGVSLYELFGRRDPVLPAGDYTRITDAALARLELRGWVAYRRTAR